MVRRVAGVRYATPKPTYIINYLLDFYEKLIRR